MRVLAFVHSTFPKTEDTHSLNGRHLGCDTCPVVSIGHWSQASAGHCWSAVDKCLATVSSDVMSKTLSPQGSQAASTECSMDLMG